MIGYPSGQDGWILPARHCPFCSRNNISPKSKGVHESFLSQNIFRDSKKIFCDFSVGMEQENKKSETRHHFCIQLASFSVLENKQIRRSFFQCSLCHIINPLLTKLVRSRWLDIGQYPAILTELASSMIYIYIYILRYTILCFPIL